MKAEHEQLGVSVVICCHNSRHEIKDTLMHLGKQSIDKSIPWEIVIVDNNSTDDTVQVATDYWKRLHLDIPLRVVPEPNLGVANARATGIKTAQYEYIVFCDDDTWFCPEYLATAYEIFTNNPVVTAISGWGDPVFEANDFPQWMHRWFACREKPALEGKDSLPAVITMGLAIKRSVLLKLFEAGFKFVQLSRKGESVNGGEDIELTLMLSILNYQFWVSPRMYYQHFITKKRTTVDHVRKLCVGKGKVKTNILPYYWLYNRRSTILRQNLVVQSVVASYLSLKNAFAQNIVSRFHALEYVTHLATIPQLTFKLHKMQRNIKVVLKNYKMNMEMKSVK